MFLRKTFLSILVPTLAFLFIFPNTAPGTKYAGDFMSSGGGARAMGMGGAFVAVAGDASTVFWNPAGVSGFKKRQALFMHSERFGDLINYNFASFITPFNALTDESSQGGLGFALFHMGANDLLITNGLKWQENNGIAGFQPEQGDRLIYDESQLPRENYNDLVLLSSFAIRTQYGRIGGSLKLLYTNAVSGYSSTGIGLDVGFLRERVIGNLNFGVKLQDITRTYISWSSGTNEYISPSLKLGFSYLLSSKPLDGSLLLALDSDVYFENRKYVSQFWVGRISADIHLGGELRIQNKVMIRGGLDAGNPTVGAGLKWGFLGFDYAYLRHDFFEATHRISGLVEF